MVLNLSKHSLGLLRVVECLIDLVIQHLALVLQRLFKVLLLLLSQLAALVYLRNLLLDLLIALFQLVVLGIQHVNVVE